MKIGLLIILMHVSILHGFKLRRCFRVSNFVLNNEKAQLP